MVHTVASYCCFGFVDSCVVQVTMRLMLGKADTRDSYFIAQCEMTGLSTTGRHYKQCISQLKRLPPACWDARCTGRAQM